MGRTPSCARFGPRGDTRDLLKGWGRAHNTRTRTQWTPRVQGWEGSRRPDGVGQEGRLGRAPAVSRTRVERTTVGGHLTRRGGGTLAYGPIPDETRDDPDSWGGSFLYREPPPPSLLPPLCDPR